GCAGAPPRPNYGSRAAAGWLHPARVWYAVGRAETFVEQETGYAGDASRRVEVSGCWGRGGDAAGGAYARGDMASGFGPAPAPARPPLRPPLGHAHAAGAPGRRGARRVPAPRAVPPRPPGTDHHRRRSRDGRLRREGGPRQAAVGPL